MFSIDPIGGSSAAQSAQLGINQALTKLAQDAQVVAASVSTPDQDNVLGALVDSLQQRLAVQESASVLGVTNQTLGTLIDIMA